MFRWLLITISVIVCTTLAVNAVDNIGNLSNSLLGSLVLPEKEKNRCPDDMVYVPDVEDGFCIDKYEVSAGEGCPQRNPSNQKQTTENLERLDCVPVSESARLPWTNIAQHQAKTACAKVGKRLPGAKEWFDSALGTPDTGVCNLESKKNGPKETGVSKKCKSSYGAYDMVGNVWEVIDERVVNGVHEGSNLATKEGYVFGIDNHGVPTETSIDPDPSFGNDYFWLISEGTRAVLRGGYWDSGDDGGVYAFHAKIPSSFAGNGVGFRCIKEIDN